MANIKTKTYKKRFHICHHLNRHGKVTPYKINLHCAAERMDHFIRRIAFETKKTDEWRQNKQIGMELNLNLVGIGAVLVAANCKGYSFFFCLTAV